MAHLFRWTLVVLLLSVASLAPALAQTQSFEEQIDEVLKRRGGQPPAGEQPPLAPAPGAIPPAPPPIVPVEPGPRPYTPPAISTPIDATRSPATPSGTGVTPDAATAPAATAERTQESLTVEEVNSVVFPVEFAPFNGASPLVLKSQVLLDRAGASPGVIDAYSGGNFSKAIAAVETVLGLPADGVLDRDVWTALAGDQAPAVLVQYTTTAEDLAYPFIAEISADYAEQAKLSSLGYMSPEEMFGERFHMDVKLLSALNPTANFRQPGTQIWVAAVDGQPIGGKIARIIADKRARQVRAYDAGNRLIVAYPATIGSPDNPSPSGEHEVKGVAPNPIYYYDPKNFVQGSNTEKLQLPPGPNSPVGSVWIDLTEPSYGIHGTPEPSKIDKTGSHGCVRLTNWDAEELAGLVEPGVRVSFTE